MSWKKLVQWFKTKKPPSFHLRSLDRRLLLQRGGRAIPTARQLKYFAHFLTAIEKRIIRIAAAAIVSAGLVFVVLFAAHHVITIPKEGGEYSEAIVGQPQYVNPLFASTNEVDADLVALMYASLFRYDDNKKLQPYLAEKYTISPDGKIYDIALRQGIKWSDGAPLTAEDVLFTFEQIQNPEIGSPLLPAFQGVQTEKTGDRSVRFTLKEPFAPFLTTLTVGIVPEHIWDETTPTNIRLAKENIQPIGAGPWQFSKLIKDEAGNIQSYVLTRNSNYFGKKPYLETLTFNFYISYEEAAEALRSQEVLAQSFAPRQNTNGKLPNKNLVNFTYTLPQYTALFFNQTDSLLAKNEELRLALAEAVDKPTLVREALQNDGAVIDAPILTGSIGYHPEIKKIPFNTEEANTLLDKKWPKIQPEEYFKLRQNAVKKQRAEEIEALKKASSTPEVISQEEKRIDEEITAAVRKEMDANQSFYRHDKNGNVLRLTMTTADTAEYLRAAELIAEMWRKIGVQTTVEPIGRRQILRDVIRDRNYQVLLYGEVVGSDPDLFPFWHSSQSKYPGFNITGYINRSGDKLLEEARVTLDEKKRAELYKKFQDLLAKEMPAVFLYTPTHRSLIHKEIRGVKNNRQLVSPPDRYNDSVQWYARTEWRWQK